MAAPSYPTGPFARGTVGETHAKAASGRPTRAGIRPAWRPLAFDDLTFLPANLSRVVIDAYREPCYTEVSLGARFAERPLTLATPLMIAPMGYPGVTREQRRAIALAARELGIAYGTGEGGFIPGEIEIGAQAVFQIGPAHLGLHPRSLAHAAAVEIVLDTANHGLGRYVGPGVLDPEMAQVWGVDLDRALQLPAAHLDFEDAEGLALKVAELREATDHQVPIVLKAGGDAALAARLAVEVGIDVLAIDGLAAPFPGGLPALIDHAGVPTLAALAAAVRALRDMGREEDVDLIVMGGVRDGADAAKCLALGANAVALGTGCLVALGCEAAVGHGLDVPEACPLEGFEPEAAAESLVNYLGAVTQEIQMISRACGKYYAQDLEPEDMRALSITTSVITGVALAGTDRIYGEAS